ncbi:carbon storage regulator [bacterium]|nr:carbon storage regulator [bacterium]
MLVITRKVSEEIIINDEIRVQVVSIRPGRIRIGIDAPSWMSVQRGEIVSSDDEKQSIDLGFDSLDQEVA